MSKKVTKEMLMELSYRLLNDYQPNQKVLMSQEMAIKLQEMAEKLTKPKVLVVGGRGSGKSLMLNLLKNTERQEIAQAIAKRRGKSYVEKWLYELHEQGKIDLTTMTDVELLQTKAMLEYSESVDNDIFNKMTEELKKPQQKFKTFEEPKPKYTASGKRKRR